MRTATLRAAAGTSALSKRRSRGDSGKCSPAAPRNDNFRLTRLGHRPCPPGVLGSVVPEASAVRGISAATAPGRGLRASQKGEPSPQPRGTFVPDATGAAARPHPGAEVSAGRVGFALGGAGEVGACGPGTPGLQPALRRLQGLCECFLLVLLHCHYYLKLFRAIFLLLFFFLAIFPLFGRREQFLVYYERARSRALGIRWRRGLNRQPSWGLRLAL